MLMPFQYSLIINLGTQVEAVTVFQDGIVGINSTIPSERLDVGGTIKTEQLNVTGVSTFTGSISFPIVLETQLVEHYLVIVMT